MKKELVIFDLYNTLIIDPSIEDQDRYRLNSMWAVLDKSGFPTTFADVIEAYDFAKEQLKSQHTNHFSISVFEAVNIFAQRLKIADVAMIKKFYDLWAYATLQFPPQLIAGVKDGLEQLKSEGKKLAIISNTAMSPGVALRFFLKEAQIYDLFDDLVFSDEFGFMKPEKMIFHRVLDRMETLPSQAIFVGDHLYYDKQGATSVGIDYIYMSPDTDFQKVVNEILSIQ